MTLYSYITLPIPLGLWEYDREFHHISFVVSLLKHHPPDPEIRVGRTIDRRQLRKIWRARLSRNMPARYIKYVKTKSCHFKWDNSTKPLPEKVRGPPDALMIAGKTVFTSEPIK
jgi:hypothetical protein